MVLRIREIIKEKGLSSKEVADKLDMLLSALNQHITGNPSVKVLSKIANALEVPLWQLFASQEEVNKENGNYIICPHCRKRIKIEKEE